MWCFKLYKKKDRESLKKELNKINKLRGLSERMQQSIMADIEVTPGEIRQFFNKFDKNDLPMIGAQIEISQIVKTPKPSDEEKEKVINRLNAIKQDIVKTVLALVLKPFFILKILVRKARRSLQRDY